MTDLYLPEYFEMRKETAGPRFWAYLHEYENIILRLKEMKTGNVLDIGCGTGDFFSFFPDWMVKYGMEISSHCIAVCENKGIHMNCGLELESFDLVIMRGVLQHLNEPFNDLRIAKNVLAPGGMLAILAQPDADSLCYRLFKDLPALDAPRNWWIPGAKELTNILTKLGFTNIEITHPYWGGPYARPVHDFACFALRLLGIKTKFAFPGNMMEVYCWKA
jgi:SAM-dependent methyltransferase